MPLFRNSRNTAALPSDIVQKSKLYGQFEMDSYNADASVAQMAAKLVPELSPIAGADPDRFISELAAAVTPHGGWAVYGGEKLVKQFFGMSSRNPDFLGMFEAAMAFRRSQGYGPPTPSEMKLWQELHPGEQW